MGGFKPRGLQHGILRVFGVSPYKLIGCLENTHRRLQPSKLRVVKNSHKFCTRYGKDSVGKFVTCRLVLGFDLVILE